MNGSKELLPYVRLRFNVAHPTLEECYAYGYECALANIEEEANPYEQDSKESHYWTEGWWTGFYGAESLFELSKDKNGKEKNESKTLDKVAIHKVQKAIYSHKNSTPPINKHFNSSSYPAVNIWTNPNLFKTLSITGTIATILIIIFQFLL